jgi:putative transposase
MMDAEVEGICGAGYGEVTPDGVNSRNGYRRREWDTRAGTVELAVPKLRQGSYYPEWLLERRRIGREPGGRSPGAVSCQETVSGGTCPR